MCNSNCTFRWSNNSSIMVDSSNRNSCFRVRLSVSAWRWRSGGTCTRRRCSCSWYLSSYRFVLFHLRLHMNCYIRAKLWNQLPMFPYIHQLRYFDYRIGACSEAVAILPIHVKKNCKACFTKIFTLKYITHILIRVF